MAHHRRRVRSAVFVMTGVVAAAGLLIWGKLRLLADVPRAAYAERGDERDSGDESAPSENEAAESDDAGRAR